MAIDNNRPVAYDVIEAAIDVCGKAFHYKDRLESLFLTAGVAADLYAKHSSSNEYKYVTARRVFRDLQKQSPPDYRTIRAVVTELANLRAPEDKVKDRAAGRAAIEQLKKLAQEKRVLVDTDQAEQEKRASSQNRRLEAVRRRKEELASVGREFAALHVMKNVQKRGYALEKLLVRLFEAYDIVYRPPYRMPREQIDGAFEFKSFHYLFEVRWRNVMPDFGDLADFKGKVDGKLESTRGVLLSMAGFDEAVVTHFMGVARGSRNNLLLIDGQDLALMIDGTVPLDEALDYKITRASQEGVWWAPLALR
jgi:hypothetical protein